MALRWDEEKLGGCDLANEVRTSEVRELNWWWGPKGIAGAFFPWALEWRRRSVRQRLGLAFPGCNSDGSDDETVQTASSVQALFRSWKSSASGGATAGEALLR
jgi:hypothetical protein